jgi:hypothetical protein
LLGQEAAESSQAVGIHERSVLLLEEIEEPSRKVADDIGGSVHDGDRSAHSLMVEQPDGFPAVSSFERLNLEGKGSRHVPRLLSVSGPRSVLWRRRIAFSNRVSRRKTKLSGENGRGVLLARKARGFDADDHTGACVIPPS